MSAHFVPVPCLATFAEGSSSLLHGDHDQSDRRCDKGDGCDGQHPGCDQDSPGRLTLDLHATLGNPHLQNARRAPRHVGTAYLPKHLLHALQVYIGNAFDLRSIDSFVRHSNHPDTPRSPVVTSNAEYLAALPPEVQDRLLDLVRAASDTTEDEKVFIMEWLSNFGEEILAIAQYREQAKLVELLSPVGTLLGAIYRADETEEVA